MARFIQAEFPTEHAGIDRLARGFAVLRDFDITRAAVTALAFVGAPVTRAAAKARCALDSFAEARRRRAADAKLWDIAVSDARVMAELSRAMSRDAARDVRGYD
jgi:hypothetical protein